MAVAAAAASLALAGVGVSTAAAAGGLPPRGHVLLGVVGPDPAAFDSLTGRHHVLHLTFGWAIGGATLEADRAESRIPVVSVEPGAPPRAVAQGQVDALLLQAAITYNEARWPVWVRPMPEMNGHWSPDCAVSTSGAPRGPAYSATWFRKAFQRISVIIHGGSGAWWVAQDPSCLV